MLRGRRSASHRFAHACSLTGSVATEDCQLRGVPKDVLRDHAVPFLNAWGLACVGCASTWLGEAVGWNEAETFAERERASHELLSRCVLSVGCEALEFVDCRLQSSMVWGALW